MKIYISCVITPEQYPQVDVFTDPRAACRCMWRKLSAPFEYPDILEEYQIEGFYAFMADPTEACKDYGFVVERDLEATPVNLTLTGKGVDKLREIIGETGQVPPNFEEILAGETPEPVDPGDYINWNDDYDDHPGGI